MHSDDLLISFNTHSEEWISRIFCRIFEAKDEYEYINMTPIIRSNVRTVTNTV